jgi:hypothetical protein
VSALATNDAYDNLFDYYGQVYNVDPLLGKTVFHLESSGNPNSKDSPAGAQGGMQIMPKLAAHYGIDPHDITQAIPASMAYLAEGLQATGGSPAGALAYYNGGPASLNRWQPETQGYVNKALSYYPQMKLTQLASNAPAATDSPAPMVMADASVPNDQSFRNRWGIGGGQPPAASGDDAFRDRWGLTPANGNAPPAIPVAPAVPAPTLVSDAAASRPPLPAPPQMGAPSTALNSLGGDQFIPSPAAPNPGQTAYSGIRNALEPAPNTTYGTLLPFAIDNATGEKRLALPSSLRTLAQGAVDLAYGPETGTVTPEATTALAASVLGAPGFMRSPANIPGRFTIFPRAAAPAANPLASAAPASSPPAAEVEAPTFAPGIGRTFDVDAEGNVTQSGLPVVSRGASAEAPNPLAARPATTPASPLTPTAPAAVAPQGPIIPEPAKITGLTPTEAAGYAAIRAPAPKTILGAPVAPPNAPPGTPPLGEPGYTPTTPGVASPTGLSPTEAAGYAAIHDTPPPAPAIPPFTKAAADKVADNLIQYFHSGNSPIASADAIVPPGYHPTLTGLTNDPGLATLHRGLESVSAAPAVVAQRNAQAINAAAQRLTGEPGDADLMQAEVNAATTPLREAAFANKTDMDPAKVQNAIGAADKILAGPDSKRPGVVKYIQQVRDSMTDADGNPETDPEMMYGAHKGINDLLTPLAQSTEADKAAASQALTSLKPYVKSAIESGAPGFEPYMATHAELMKPVNAQRYLESLNLTSATGDTRLAAVDSAIKNITKQQAAPGISKAEWVSPDQLGQLTALRNALRMEATRGTGKPINSTTFQNLATNSMVSRIAGNPLVSGILGQISHPGFGGYIAGQAATHFTQSQLAKSEAMVKEAVLERLLNFSGKGEATLAPPKPAPRAPWNPLNPAQGNAAPGAPSTP